MSSEEGSIRIPMGIYKIVGDKLIIGEVIEYHRYYGGFDMGVSRYEFPKDFSGSLKEYQKCPH
jgi:hypothetical protein